MSQQPSDVQLQKKDFQNNLERMRSQFVSALPQHITADVFMRVALTTVTKNPKLLKCTPSSLFGALIQCSQLGLMPDDVMGHAWLIPYEQKKGSGVYICQFQPGYKGVIQLIKRARPDVSVRPRVVHKGDDFEYDLAHGIEKHKPTENSQVGDENITHFYAVLKYSDGSEDFDVMTKKQVDEHKVKFSKNYGSDDSPWKTNYEAMGKKTVLLQVAKYAEISTEINKLSTLEGMLNEGKNQKNSSLLEGFELPENIQKQYEKETSAELQQEEEEKKETKKEEKKQNMASKSQSSGTKAFDFD